jgi:hypothetical protein
MSLSAKAHTITTALINQIKTQYPDLNIYRAEKPHGAFYGTMGKQYIYVALDIFTQLEFEVWEDSGLIYLLGENLPRPSFLHTKEHFSKCYVHILNLIKSKQTV